MSIKFRVLASALAIISLVGMVEPATSEAGLNIFDKAKEAIGWGPSDKRIKRKIKPGTAMVLANGQKYQIVDIGGGYRKAKLYAERLGGHLAKIETPGENRLLYDFMIAQGYKAAYFGLSDVNLDGQWEYADGTKAKYTNWHKEHPEKDDPHMVYAMLYSLYTNAKWKSGTFSNMVKVKGGTAFIIEWDKKYIVNPPPIRITGGDCILPPPPKVVVEEDIISDETEMVSDNITEVSADVDVISGE